MKNLKQNLVIIAGNVSFIDIKESTQKPGEFFGNLNIAYDDGYFDKTNNNIVDPTVKTVNQQI